MICSRARCDSECPECAGAVVVANDFEKPASPEFLAELLHRARRFGWMGDYTELVSFMSDLYRTAGLPEPDMEPFPIEDV